MPAIPPYWWKLHHTTHVGTETNLFCSVVRHQCTLRASLFIATCLTTLEVERFLLDLMCKEEVEADPDSSYSGRLAYILPGLRYRCSHNICSRQEHRREAKGPAQAHQAQPYACPGYSLTALD